MQYKGESGLHLLSRAHVRPLSAEPLSVAEARAAARAAAACQARRVVAALPSCRSIAMLCRPPGSQAVVFRNPCACMATNHSSWQ